MIFCVCTTSSAATEEAVTTETARLNAWLDARYEEELLRSPIHLTELGRKTRYGEIDDLSEAAELAEYRALQISVEQMRREFDYAKLTAEGGISFDYWVYRLQRYEASLPFLRHEYQFTTEGGMHSYLPDFLINLHTVDTEQEMFDYIARIRQGSRALLQSLERAQIAAKEGIRPSRFAYEKVIDVAGKVIAGAPFTTGNGVDSPLWGDANTKISSLATRGIITEASADNLRRDTAAALRSDLLPAYRQLITWLLADLGNAPAEPRGVGSLPNGAAYYQYLLEQYTTTDMTADQIHKLGLEEVARLSAEMEIIKNRAGFSGSLQDFFEFIRGDARFYFPNDAAGREAYIAQTEQYIESMNARLPDYFGTLPDAVLVVRRVEPFMEQDGMAPYYLDGTEDGSRPATYYMHLSDMTALNKTDIETTAYHETIPGHHLQNIVAMSRHDLPLFRTDIWDSVYVEGWALYAERLAKEMGAFKEPYSDAGRLAGELFRAVRLVVDTGVHALGWSEQQAVDYMLANLPFPRVTVQSEVRRYFADPGQATSYKVGMLKLLALRSNAEAVLGDCFDIRGFHDAVLGGGSLPLPLLEKRVNEWVASQAQSSPNQCSAT